MSGKQLPADHGYLVYSAISKSFSSLHGSDWLAIELISGFPSGRGLIALPERDATLRLRHGVKYAGRRLHVEIEKKEDQRTRKGSVLAEPDIPRRRKKSNVFGKSEKAPWETEPANAKAAEVKGSSGGESDSAPDEGEPLRLNLESEKWDSLARSIAFGDATVCLFPTSTREDALRALPITNPRLGPATVCKSSLTCENSNDASDLKSVPDDLDDFINRYPMCG